MELEDIHKVYLLGIGGIGMSALARWFHLQGIYVAGFDAAPSWVTDRLIEMGIPVHYEDNEANIPDNFKQEQEKLLVVFTPAIPADSPEKQYFMREGYTLKKRSEVLGMITRDHFTIAVAGTHGKTSTSAMLAHILFEAGRNMVAFLGGITRNYESNFVLTEQAKLSLKDKHNLEKDTILVVEADEFDRSFLRLFPEIAIITNIDPDHLDIYGNVETMEASFNEFSGQINSSGKLILHQGVSGKINKVPEHTITYGLGKGDYSIGKLNFNNDPQQEPGCVFEVKHGEDKEGEFKLNVPGYHNIENSLAAIITARELNIPGKKIREALTSFKGVKRRFEYIINANRKDKFLVFIDDYAHHPEEINQLLTSVRAIYEDKKISVIFQPHLYSRTRDFADGFGESLSLADELLLLDIYPAREKPIPGVSAGMILERVTAREKGLYNMDTLIDNIKDKNFEVLLTVGAGSIDRLVEPLAARLRKRYNLNKVA